MKESEKNNRNVCRLHKSNNSWKWVAGATSAAAAGITSQAAATTITLVNNYIAATGGNHLNADLTGDGHPDLTITGAAYGFVTANYRDFNTVRVNLNGVLASAFVKSYDWPYNFGQARLGSVSRNFYPYPYHHSSTTIVGLIPVFFKDLRINGGAPTLGSLEVTVFAAEGYPGSNPTRVELDSLTYASNTLTERSRVAVPEQGSNLGLLAMGAGGVFALRRWRTDRPT